MNKTMELMDEDVRKKLNEQINKTCDFSKNFGFEYLVDEAYYDKNQPNKNLISPTDTFSKNTYLGDKKAYIVGCLWGAARNTDIVPDQNK